MAPADPHDGADATFPSALGVGERLCIRIDALREEPAPGVAAGQCAAGSATTIQIIVHHLGRAVDVSPSTARLVGHLGRRSSPRRGPAISGSGNDSSSGREARDGRGEGFAALSDDGEGSNSRSGRNGSISRSDGDTSNRSSRSGSQSGGDRRSSSRGDDRRSDGDNSTRNNDLEGQQQQEIRDKKPMTLQDELRGVFDILVLVIEALIPIALLAYALLPEDNPSAQRIAWITLGVVVGLAIIAAVISRLATTETAAEVSASIGLLCTVVLIVVSEIVLAKCLPYDFSSFVCGTIFCIILLIADIYAWTECTGRPKVANGAEFWLRVVKRINVWVEVSKTPTGEYHQID
ncbi:hypothetical protein EJB05_21774, partial [Eragrostis curvula]